MTVEITVIAQANSPAAAAQIVLTALAGKFPDMQQELVISVKQVPEPDDDAKVW